MTTASGIPNVFDAALPTIDYAGAQSPDEAQAVIRAAREEAPIAMGPHGPEVLTYDLAHEVLRDPRFRIPQGMFLVAQGITSGPVWDRASASIISIDGPEHTRLRRLVATAFSRRAIDRLRATVVDVVSDLVDRQVARGHYCLGVHLAKMELAEALALMTQRMPNARVTGPVPWKPLLGLSGPITLPIAFDRVDQSWRAAS
ncbi:hypothetical protein ACNO8X_23020 [Mycobacterium sp. PDNC021]|uniref:hypothetical protein n=1 Tax=Mycobacterium sp. PDNC021 TaxID=3391399 RepID=UPI003AAD7F8A